MPDPISSFSPNNPLECHVDDKPEAAPAATVPATGESMQLTCTAEALTSAASPPGAQSLVARFTPPPALPPTVPTSVPPVISHTVLSKSSGVVPGGGSYRVEFTGLKAQVESGTFKGSGVEHGTAYVQYGKDNDVQVTAERRTVALSGHGYGVTFTGEAGVLRANLGEHNDDGSIGGNIGAGAELIGAEVTVDTPVGSVTYGKSASMSLSGSMGVRDKDHDGEPEFCGKFSIPAFTVGACVEKFW